jgi:hypothetical protein
MTMPSLTAEASLYTTSRHYGYVVVSALGIFDSVLAQSLFCARLGQTCGGIDLVCCPGLRCTAAPGGLGICVPGHVPCCQPPGCQICPEPL